MIVRWQLYAFLCVAGVRFISFGVFRPGFLSAAGHSPGSSRPPIDGIAAGLHFTSCVARTHPVSTSPSTRAAVGWSTETTIMLECRRMEIRAYVRSFVPCLSLVCGSDLRSLDERSQLTNSPTPISQPRELK